jgi:hypothetical protein
MPVSDVSQVAYRYESDEKGVRDSGLSKFSVVYKDVYSWEYFYMLLHEWLVDEGYGSADDEDWQELIYEQLETPIGKEIFLRWRFQKPGQATFAKLFKYEVDIDIHILGQNPVEVVLDGKKIKADKGEIEVKVNADLLNDPDKVIRDKWWYKLPMVEKLVWRFFLKNAKDTQKGILRGDMNALQAAIKSYLNLHTFSSGVKLSAMKKRAKPE